MKLEPKLCSHCGIEFIPVKYISQRFCSIKCRKAYHNIKSDIKHREQRLIHDKKFRKENASRLAIKSVEYRKKHKAEHQIWINAHRTELREKKREYIKNRNKIDPSFKLRKSLSRNLYLALRGIGKSTHTLELLGCSVDSFKRHLEALFLPGMTWESWGQYGWHIDHIKPISLFDLTDPEQQKICFHYSNMQPLWWRDNLSKSNKV